ncbi:MAG: FAD binding domain-containing protein, partial [Verrucomicrobiota bacterium]
MKSSYEISVNGETHRVEGAGVGLVLRDFLRACGVTSVKEACEEECYGGCTVVLDERGVAGALRYRAISSCTTLLATVAGKRVLTAEGVEGLDGACEVREAVVSTGASLCGYCTPGLVMTLFEAVHRDDLLTQRDLHEQLLGNVCRCTGYQSMKAAGLKALRRLRPADVEGGDMGRRTGVFNPGVAEEAGLEGERDREEETLEGGSGEFQYVDACGGRFYRPASLSEMLVLLGQDREAVIVAGGMGTDGDLKRGESGAGLCFVSIEGVEDFKGVAESSVSWDIGAAAPLGQVRASALGRYPLVEQVLCGQSRQILNRATVGGFLLDGGLGLNEWAGVLLAMGAQVRLASADGERESGIDHLLNRDGRVRLRDGEVMVSIRVPRVKPTGGRLMAKHYRVPASGGGAEVAGCFSVLLDSKKGRVEEA